MNVLDLELRHLLTFKEVADRRSFGRAAETLGYTQSAVSQQIARLEQVVGQPLFYRPGGPKPVALTQAGELLLPRVDEVIGRLRSIENDLAGLGDGMVGRVSVGTFQSVSVRLLPRIVAALNGERPELEVELLESMSGDVLRRAMVDRNLDVTFWVAEDGDDWAGFEMIPLFEDHFVVVAPSDSPHDVFGPAELAQLPMIGQHNTDQCQRRIDSGLRRHGFEPRYVFRSGDNSAVQAMVRAGQGVAVMPTLAVDASDPHVVIRPIEPPLPPRVVVLVVREGERIPAAVQRFIELARDVSAELFVGTG